MDWTAVATRGSEVILVRGTVCGVCFFLPPAVASMVMRAKEREAMIADPHERPAGIANELGSYPLSLADRIQCRDHDRIGPDWFWATDFVIFVKVGDSWLIDSLIENVVITGEATPAT